LSRLLEGMKAEDIPGGEDYWSKDLALWMSTAFN
jgi:hypothetical protein